MTNTISNEYLTIKVNKFGAELASIQYNKTGKEYLWQADPTYWKRHSPILFPIVGAVWNNKYLHEGKEYTLTQHGFARDNVFELVDNEADLICYRLASNAETLKAYPFGFELLVAYKLVNNTIEVIWQVKNTGKETLHFQIGAHPAFNFPSYDKSKLSRGYFAFDTNEDLRYKLLGEKDCLNTKNEYILKLNNHLLPLDIHTFDKGALIFENSQIKKVSLLDDNKNAEVTLHFTSPLVGLWSPPEKNAPFVCIEPWYGRCDDENYAGEFKDREWTNLLEEGQVFDASYTIEINK